VLSVVVAVLEGAAIAVVDVAEAEVIAAAAMAARVQTRETCTMMERAWAAIPTTTVARWATGPVNAGPKQRKGKPTQSRITSYRYFWRQLLS
jgi:trehalose-6-phosphate synthase